MITNKGYKIKFSREDYQKINKDLTFIEKETSYNENRPKKTIKCFKTNQSKTNIYIPRSYGIKTFGYCDDNYFNDAKSVHLDFNGTLRPEQDNIVETILEHIYKKKETDHSGIVNLSTGSGKTTISLNLVSLLKAKTIVFVNKKILLDQWVERIKQFLPRARIGIIQGVRFEIEDVDITIAMYQTFSQQCSSYNRLWFNTFKMLICDEVHNISTIMFCKILDYVQPKYRLGLTATLRKDGFEGIYHAHLGDVIVQNQVTIVEPIIKVYKSDIFILMELTKWNKTPNYSKMITDICKHDERNNYIVDIILKHVTSTNKRKLIVFTDRVSHCEALHKCIQNKKCNSLTVGLFTGKIKKTQIEDELKCDIICATYSIAKEGFDLPSLDTLLFATPKADVVQALGRILRQKNNNIPLVIDIFDHNIPLLKGSFFKRLDYYKKQKYMVTYNRYNDRNCNYNNSCDSNLEITKET